MSKNDEANNNNKLGVNMNNDKKNAMNKCQRADSSNGQENKKSDSNQQNAGTNSSSKFDKQSPSEDRNKKDNKSYNNKSSKS